MKCPVCGNETFDDNEYVYHICAECCWEYDRAQVKDPDFPGGANHHSLNEYRKIYRKLKEANPNFSCKNDEDRERIIALDQE